MVGILAPPDSKKGRGQDIQTHLLKKAARKLGVSVFQPEKLNNPNFLREFKKIKLDLVVVVAYGKLFPKEILDIPPLGFVNFHPSLLPKMRGPSPIASAILEGHEVSGVSIMKLGEGMDDGPILAQKAVRIDPRETSESLTRKLVNLGKKMLPETLKKYLVRTQHAVFLQQDNSKATYCRLLRKEDGHINWHEETAEQIDRKVRALNPQFKTFTFLKRNDQVKRANILETVGIYVGTGHDPSQTKINPGQFKLSNGNLAIVANKDILLVSKLQVEGKNPISAEDFLRGYSTVDNKFLLV